MTRQVLEQDTHGNPTVILFTESAADLAEDRQELQEEEVRAQDVARSLLSPESAVGGLARSEAESQNTKSAAASSAAV